MFLTYEEMNNQIENYYLNKIYVDEIVLNEDKIKSLLIKLKQDKIDNNIYKDFTVTAFDTNTFLKYISIDETKSIKKNNIIIYDTNSQIPIIKVSNINNQNDDIKYDESTYITYDNKGHIEAKLNIKKYELSHITTYTITMLNKFSKTEKEYNSQAFTIILNKDEVISYSSNDRIFLKDEEGFDPRLNVALTHLNNITNSIQNRLDETLEKEKTKIYTIKKKQGR